MDIYIKRMTGKTFPIHVESDDTIMSVKYKIQDYTGIPPSQGLLVYGKTQLKDERTLRDYDIGNEETIHLILKLRGD